MNLSIIVEEFKKLSEEERHIIITMESAYILDELYRRLSEELLAIVILGRFNKHTMMVLKETLSSIHKSLLDAQKGKEN